MTDSLISTERRRLTIGDPKNEANYDQELARDCLTRPESNRGLVKFLNEKGLLEISGLEKKFEPKRGSFTMSGLTTALGGENAFDEKKCESESDDTTVVNLAMVESIGVGIACKKGLKPEAPNQDSYCYVHAIGDSPNAGGFDLYGVFDGHGVSGHVVSNYVRASLPKLFLSDPFRGKDPKHAMLNSFANAQKLLETDPLVDCDISGSTATLAYREKGCDEITIAHCGDSRAILVYESKGKAIGVELTPDHKPELPAEKKRIEASGGAVIFDGYYNHRVFKKGTFYPGLNMSRAFGDMIGQREAGIVATPDVKTVNVKAKYDFLALIICSDGVWEFIDNNEAAKMVLSTRKEGKIDPTAAAQMLATEAWNRWMDDTGGETSDDITVVIQVLD